MNFFTQIYQFLKGSRTARELLALAVTSLLAALLALGIFHTLRTKQPEPVATEFNLIRDALQAQHRADSAQALLTKWQQQRRIDSLTLLLLKRNELDSMRANAGLSTLDALRKINGAIQHRR